MNQNIVEVAESATPEYSKAFYDEQIQKLYKAVGWDKRLSLILENGTC
jgi:hypothetical protein